MTKKDPTEAVSNTELNTTQPERVMPVAVVGIGASAGGLEAIQSFFENTPIDSSLAFVVVQHLSPDYKSLMVELLARKTRMTVLRAEEGMPVEANHVYLIPPRKNLRLFHGKLSLEDQPPHKELPVNLPVDIFLESLAEDLAGRAVAVILSGTGSDGTRGVRAVKEAGGLVFVQDEESAQFEGMPKSAATTGTADFVLPPEKMPKQIIACVNHPLAQQSAAKEIPIDETGMTRIFSLLRSATKVDFTYYKPSTILRRIERRITVTQMDDLESYVRYLEQTPAEVKTLYRELLIGVTNFFRDPPVMNALQEEVLPELLRKDPGREMRFWCAGCSTGEEAYTLAILCREVMERLAIQRDIKIFATDIDREAVLRAGAGIYPESIAADLPPHLLTKYFYRRKEGWQIIRTIREMVVIAQHNLVKDPPFTRIDLVSCRNLLIYLQTNLQVKAMEMFNFALHPGGILLLGTSETTGEMEPFFEPVERKLKIYRSRGHSSANRLIPAVTRSALTPIERSQTPAQTERRQHERFHDRLLELLGNTYVPLAIVVNEQLDVQHTVGDSGGIFKMPSGPSSFEITRWVDSDLAIPLSTGIQKVFQTGEELVYSNIRLHNDEGPLKMRMRITPLPGRKNDVSLVAVFLEQIEQKTSATEAPPEEYNVDEQTLQRLQDLEQELQFTRENLQATIEELETSNEELQASNEELLASNEELQSTNEELQSTNEELYTVNTEYQTKIIELTEAQNDINNLLTSSHIGTLILDEDLCIRRYSPCAAEVFNILESDAGRPLDHLSHRLSDFNPAECSRRVQKQKTAFEKDVQSEDGRWYLVRIMPYQIGPKTFSGAVISLVDITTARQNGIELTGLRQESKEDHPTP